MYLSKLQLESLYSLTCVSQMKEDDELYLVSLKEVSLYLYNERFKNITRLCFFWDNVTKTWKEKGN